MCCFRLTCSLSTMITVEDEESAGRREECLNLRNCVTKTVGMELKTKRLGTAVTSPLCNSLDNELFG